VRRGEATVTIRLADAAQAFVEHALDLLEAVETSDPALITDRAREAAEEFREFIDRERGEW
jgi:hypothetical protein